MVVPKTYFDLVAFALLADPFFLEVAFCPGFGAFFFAAFNLSFGFGLAM
jgi:hypothetical protein